jgi:general nucleoside transport system ATP-binding protein
LVAQPNTSEPETVLRLDSITKRFGAMLANDAISFTLKRGEIIGLLGENGAGKTTLMNILFGHYVADKGTIEVNGRPLAPGNPALALGAGVGMVHQHFTLADNLTALENIVLGTEKLFSPFSKLREARKRIKELSSEFGLTVDPDATVASLSVGERQRIEILKALYRNARILILDEPTAVLTPQESQSLFETLKILAEKGLSIILISHKLGEVLAACSRVLVLRAGALVAERHCADVNRQELGELMVGRAVPRITREMMLLGGPVLRLSKVSAKRGGQQLRNLDLAVRARSIAGIAGVAGNGQSLLADLLSGLVQPTSGAVELNGETLEKMSPASMIGAGVARIPEDRHAEGLIGDMSIAENVISENYRSNRYARAGFISWSQARKSAEDVIQRYEVKCPSPEAPVRLLSGGNMQKLILGRVLSGQPRLVLANQPTRGLDVGAVAYVHEQLLQALKGGAGIILISEDLDELLALSDVIYVMYRGELSEPLPTKQLTIADLGLRMAGQGFSNAA